MRVFCFLLAMTLSLASATFAQAGNHETRETTDSARDGFQAGFGGVPQFGGPSGPSGALRRADEDRDDDASHRREEEDDRERRRAPARAANEVVGVRALCCRRGDVDPLAHNEEERERCRRRSERLKGVDDESPTAG